MKKIYSNTKEISNVKKLVKTAVKSQMKANGLVAISNQIVANKAIASYETIYNCKLDVVVEDDMSITVTETANI